MSKQRNQNNCSNSSNERIHPVLNNMDKYYTYKEIVTRYNRAYRNGFYFEAIFIDYAMIEDRLRSMLYHMAIFYRPENAEGLTAYPFDTNEMSNARGNKTEQDILRDHKLSISKKFNIVLSVVNWAHTTEENYEEGSYLSMLKNVCKGVEMKTVLDELKLWDDRSDIWTQYRNDLTHDLLNQNMESVDRVLKPCAKQGMVIAQKLDVQLKRIKKDNLLRNSIGAPIKK